MTTHELAIWLTSLGGAAEALGVLTVVREIAEDRKRARAMLSVEREPSVPERREPPALNRHSFGVGGFGGRGVVASSQRPTASEEVTDLAAILGNTMIAIQKEIYDDRDELERRLLKEMDAGYNGVRTDLKDALSGDTTIRLGGVGLLLLGVALSTAGALFAIG